MSRDHRKLRVFTVADGLVTKIYSITQDFPAAERFGLQSQLRRAAVSAACNIVEGCARRGENEYLGFLCAADSSVAMDGYRELAARLQALIKSLSPEP